MIVIAYFDAQIFPDLGEHRYECLGDQRQMEGGNPFKLPLHNLDMFSTF